ncbi:MAG: ornithine cyclodeaminase family protein [Planctomycetota bacterium]
MNGEAVRAALPVDDAIEAVRAAYIACSTGHGAAPERVALDLPGDRNVALFMPGFMDAANCRSLVIKTVTVFPANPQRGLPMNQGALLAIDPGTGAACGLLDTATVTAIRTAAGSAVATDCLARSDATSLAVLGTGVLAPEHIAAILKVRDVRRVRIWGRTGAHAERLAERVRQRHADVEIEVVPTADDAVSRADIVCTLTPSERPLFADDRVADGAHVNAVGAFRPTMCELPPETIGRSRVFVDQRSAALVEAGDLMQAEQSGAFSWDDLAAEIGEVASGAHPGRAGDDEITVFKSVGMSLQDAATAAVALANAEREGIGHVIDWP